MKRVLGCNQSKRPWHPLCVRLLHRMTSYLWCFIVGALLIYEWFSFYFTIIYWPLYPESVKGTDYLLEQPNTKRNATAISTSYALKLSPWKIGIVIEKWGNRWKLIWWQSGMDKIKCWTEAMGTLLRQMCGNLYLEKWKHSI